MGKRAGCANEAVRAPSTPAGHIEQAHCPGSPSRTRSVSLVARYKLPYARHSTRNAKIARMANSIVKLFLSYASEDERQVEQIYDRLLNDGLTPWMARRNIHPGENWQRAIWRAIREADFVLVCLSKSAVGKRGVMQ